MQRELTGRIVHKQRRLLDALNVHVYKFAKHVRVTGRHYDLGSQAATATEKHRLLSAVNSTHDVMSITISNSKKQAA